MNKKALSQMNYYIKTKEWKHIFKILQTKTNVRSRNEDKLRLFIEDIGI